MPTTNMETGAVAKTSLGASMCPTMVAVAYTTVEFAPASACAIDSRTTLPGRYPMETVTAGVALNSACDIRFLNR